MCNSLALCDGVGVLRAKDVTIHVGVLPAKKRFLVCIKERGLPCQPVFMHKLTAFALIEALMMTTRQACESESGP